MKSNKEEKTSTIPQMEILLEFSCFQMQKNIIKYNLQSLFTILPEVAEDVSLSLEHGSLNLRKGKSWLDQNPDNIVL